MSYQKLVTIFSKRERENFHRQGYWIDRNGSPIRVLSMNYERLDKLVRMLVGWAMDENNPSFYIRNLVISPFIYTRIYQLRMNTYQASVFKSAMEFSLIRNDWQNNLSEPSPEEWAIMNKSALELQAQFESEN